ncbi:MAG: citramalate synthase, partial [Verrucomicrobiaceae bacterium]
EGGVGGLELVASFELLIRRTLGLTTPLFDHVEFECVFRRDTLRDYENCLATVKLHLGGETILTVAEGGGPVNALDGALRQALVSRYPDIARMQLTDYKVRIIDGHRGTAARTRVLIDSTDGSGEWSTVGVSGNIIDASWRALVDSIEYFLMKKAVAK